VLAAVVAALVVIAVVGVLRQPEPAGLEIVPLDSEFAAFDHNPAAAAALIDAWARWRTATVVTSGTWTRQLDAAEAPLTGTVYLAQDPPNRVSIRLSAEVSRIEDQERFDRLNANELVLVGGYVTGESRIYNVEFGDPGCFVAQLNIWAPASPWGLRAEYCFDDASGALVSARVRRQSATDIEVITDIRTTVTGEDFGPVEE